MKLKLIVGIALVLFVILAAYIIIVGMMQEADPSKYGYQSTDPTKKTGTSLSVVQSSSIDSQNTVSTSIDNSASNQNTVSNDQTPTPTPAPVYYQPVRQRPVSRAS